MKRPIGTLEQWTAEQDWENGRRRRAEGRHVGPIRTNEVLYSEGVYVVRDPGNYVGRHRQ